VLFWLQGWRIAVGRVDGSMANKERVKPIVYECEGEFELENFPAICASTKTISFGNPNCHEIVSGPLLQAERYRFGIGVVWMVREGGAWELEKSIGIYVKRLDSDRSDATVQLQMQILNRSAGKNRLMIADDYYSMASGIGYGWSPSFGNARGVPDMKLSRVFDTSQGWLHDGSLRIACKLSVVKGLGKTASGCSEAKDQQELCGALRALLASGQLCDMVVSAGGERIEAHKAILAARSPVFASMFSCPMRESAGGEVLLDDLPAPTVRALLTFLYTGEAAQVAGDEQTTALLKAAHRFQVPGLVRRCAQALAECLTVETAADRLETAELIGCAELKSQCLDYIAAHVSEVQSTESYSKMAERRPALLKDILGAAFPPAKRQRSSGGP